MDAEERYAVALLSPLAGEPSPVSRVDVAKAVADGGKLRRRRWWASGAATLSLLAGTAVGGTVAIGALNSGPGPKPPPTFPPDPPAPASCTLAELPLAGVPGADVRGTDPTGHFLVGSVDPGDGGPHPVIIWKDGRVVTVDLGLDQDLAMADINAQGIAVGSTFGEPYTPWFHRDGVNAQLKGGAGTAVAINARGMVAGSLGDRSGSRPVVWPSVSAEPRDLPLPAGASTGEAVDIADDGTVLGTLDDAGADTPYLWLPDGAGQPIPSLSGFSPRELRNGWVYGVVTTADGRPLPYRYSLAVRRFQPLPAVAASAPQITVGTRPYALPADPQAGGRSYAISAISDDYRTVAGYAQGAGLPSRPLLWTCR